MALKEIKERINSISSTRKTTSAMKMVSSAKLHKAQATINDMLPYSESLRNVMQSLLSNEFTTPFAAEREIKNVTIITFSSDSSLCGAFNANIIREMLSSLDKYKKQPQVGTHLYTIGKKVYDAAKKANIEVEHNFENLAAKPDYATIAAFTEQLMQDFLNGRTDRVELIYHHFKSAGSQKLIRETILPLSTHQHISTSAHQHISTSAHQHIDTSYIYEPSREKLIETLIPKSIKLQLYTALLDSNASEHAARMIAMQTATDNADDLINELTVEYNKSRQNAITTELLDIISGSVKR